MIGFRSDHACIMHKSETDWMHARGQPASARAWPAASGQLAGWPVASARVLRYQIGIWRARIHGAPCPLHLRAPNTYLVPWIYDLNFDFWGTHYRHDKAPIAAIGIALARLLPRRDASTIDNTGYYAGHVGR